MKLIIGGGISGLSAGHYLLKKQPNAKIVLAEASDRFGGWIQSTKSDNGKCIFEKGPHTIRPKGYNGLNTLKIIEEIGLASKVIPLLTSTPAAKNRMIYVNKKLHTLPSSFLKACTRVEPFNRPLLVSILSDLFAKKKEIHDEPIYDFVERRFGKDVADYAISPLICGICAGDAKEISVNFLMQPFFDLEQKHGGIIKGLIKTFFHDKDKKSLPNSRLGLRAQKEKWSVYTIDGGMDLLPQAMKNHLENKIKIYSNSPCTKLEFYHRNVFATFKDQSLVAKHVISSLLAKDTAKLLGKQHPKLAELLYQIPTVTVAVINLQYSKSLPQIKEAFGFLVPPSQGIPILGVIFDHCFSPESRDQTVLTVMLGGRFYNKYFGEHTSDEQLYETALHYVKDILKVEDVPDAFSVNLLKDCIPQYTVGHNDRVKAINHYIEYNKLPLSLCGSSYYGVGINDVILSGKRAALAVS